MFFYQYVLWCNIALGLFLCLIYVIIYMQQNSKLNAKTYIAIFKSYKLSSTSELVRAVITTFVWS